MACASAFVFKGKDVLVDADGRLPQEDVFRTVTGCAHACLPGASATFTDVGSGLTAVLLPDGGGPLPSVLPGDSGWQFVPLRQYFAVHEVDADASFLPDEDTSLASRMKALVTWRASMRFCPSCGAQLSLSDKENALICPSCGRIHYPRIEPCIIAVISRGDDILLLRHRLRNSDIWCCLAGFVEAGESLEHALVREVREEVGLEIKDVRYAGSQGWPFPDQLMVGFRAEYAGGSLRLQEDEIMEARWFSRDALPPHPARGSISWHLIHDVR